MTHDYRRHSTTTLFAALNVLEGKVTGCCMAHHRHQAFIRFLDAIEAQERKAIHAIVDNYATHKHPKVRRWLARHLRWTFHFTPTSASWLNAVRGDGVLVYFGYPQAHEDDAERAVRVGLELVQALGGLQSGVSLQTRVGIATGLVVIGDLIGSGAAQEQAVVGETPNVAAHLKALPSRAPSSSLRARETLWTHNRPLRKAMRSDKLGAMNSIVDEVRPASLKGGLWREIVDAPLTEQLHDKALQRARGQ
jgi:class 3 adenylate cyclase